MNIYKSLFLLCTLFFYIELSVEELECECAFLCFPVFCFLGEGNVGSGVFGSEELSRTSSLSEGPGKAFNFNRSDTGCEYLLGPAVEPIIFPFVLLGTSLGPSAVGK